MRRLAIVVAVGFCFASIWINYAPRAIGSDPTTEAIQTQIAGLEATMTAIAPNANATPTDQKEFVFTGKWYDARFHVVVGAMDVMSQPLYEIISDELLSPRGKFIAVEFEITNTGNEPVAFWEQGMLSLRDSKGRSFSPNSDASIALVSDRDLFVYDYQPGLSYETVVVWDVPIDASGFTLDVNETGISIPLTERP